MVRLARRIFGADASLVTLLDVEDEPGRCPERRLRPDCSAISDHPGRHLYGSADVHGVDGTPVGRLCVHGREERRFGADELESLRELAGIIDDEIAATASGTIDELTGLANRRGFELVGRTVLEVCRRTGRAAGLLFLDLDGLKETNDRHGHAAGDRALRAFADVLATTFRASDVVARIGGDEFVVLLGPTDALGEAVDKLVAAMTGWNARSSEPFALSTSIGTARFDPDAGPGLDDLLERADAAMYRDKHQD